VDDAITLAVAMLATWRISASIYYGKEFEPLRRHFMLAENADGQPLSWIGRQLACFWCITFWAAWPVALMAWLWWYALIPFALSGAAILFSCGGRVIWRTMVE